MSVKQYIVLAYYMYKITNIYKNEHVGASSFVNVLSCAQDDVRYTNVNLNVPWSDTDRGI